MATHKYRDFSLVFVADPTRDTFLHPLERPFSLSLPVRGLSYLISIIRTLLAKSDQDSSSPLSHLSPSAITCTYVLA